MWTVLHISPNTMAAEQIKSVLEQEGILVSLRSDSGVTEVLVSELEAEEAHEILTEKFVFFPYRGKHA
jgi:hypothetical protein